jgi:hypothetical protein
MDDDTTDENGKRRRELLKALGGTATVAGLGGCLRFISGDDSTATPTAGTETEPATATPTDGDGGDSTDTPTDGDGGDSTDTPTDGDGGDSTDTPTDGDGGDGGDSTDTPTDGDGGDGGDGSTDTPTEEPTPTETATPTPSGSSENCILNTDRSPDCSSAEQLSGTISQDRTIGTNCDYIKVTGSVEIESGATLTVEPGTTVEFAQDTNLYVNGSGAINAVGSCNEPIVFTGEQTTAGYWQGIGLKGSDKMQSKLHYVLVEAAGSTDFYNANDAANLAVMNGARISVKNSVIRKSAGYGAFLDKSVTIDTFDGNMLTGNSSGAAYVWTTSAHTLSDSGTYSGNDNDFVKVAGNVIGSGSEVTWDALDVPYRVFSGNTVETEGHLTIAPGTTVEFNQDASVYVNDGGPGALTAEGTSGNQITFTGTQDTKGYWQGIGIKGSKRTENKLTHCVVENAGASGFYNANDLAGLAIMNGSRVVVDNTTFRKNSGYGVFLGSGVNTPSFENNTLTKNASGAAYVWSTSAHHLSDSGTYAGNDDDFVHVAGNVIGSDMEVTWDAIDVPYRVFSGNTVEMEGHLTIEPGTTVEFGQGASMYVNDGGPGRLTAEGTADNQITFTGTQEIKGYWQGIGYKGTNRTENKIIHCVIDYGGSTDFYNANDAANLAVMNEARLTLKNSTLRNSGGYGLDLRSSNVTRSNNTYENNESGGVSQN